MNNTETTFLLGYVEQAVGGSQDPLDPPISISSNGSLAKWRDKMNFIDIRVNDPGLKNDSEAFEKMLEKTQELGIEAILTLPEYIGSTYKVPPALNPSNSIKREDEKIRGKRKIYQRPEKIVHFRPCYLAIPNAFKDSTMICAPVFFITYSCFFFIWACLQGNTYKKSSLVSQRALIL